MEQEGIYLVQISESRTGEEIIKTLDLEIPQTIPELLGQSREIADKLGDKIQQVYYTCGRVRPKGNKKREGLDQDCIMFDIDHVIQDKKDQYISVFLNEFGLEHQKTGIVDSGYGLQFIVQVEEKFFKKDFDECREYFTKHKRLLEIALEGSGLIGKFTVFKKGAPVEVKTALDTAVYRPVSLARMPWTLNHAPAKKREPRGTTLIQGKVEPQAKTLVALMQKNLGCASEPDEKPSRKIVKVDGPYVKENCGFLKWGLTHTDEVHENDFFLIVGLLKNCENSEEEGEKACLEYFRALQKVTKSPTLAGYSEQRALDKIIRAKPASYMTLDKHSDKSKSDPGRPNITHPLQLRSKEFIATADTGFHKIVYAANGHPKKVPDYSDLQKFFEQQHPYVSCNEEVWAFTGKMFVKFEEIELQNFAQTHFNPFADTKMVSEFRNLVLRTNLKRPSDWARESERKVNFPNGVLDIDTGEFIPHEGLNTMKFGFRSILPYDYDPAARAPHYEKFLDDVTSGSKEFQNIVNEFAGYAISGDKCWLPQTLLLHGPGGGGKSKLLDVIKSVAGEANYSTLSFEDLNNEQSRAMLENKFFNVFDETEGTKYMETKVWKTLTTGGEVTVKKVYLQPYTIKNRAKMLFSCNSIPKSNDASDGFFRRWLVVPFVRNFAKEGIEDPFIDEKLATELPGIFNLFLAGYKRLKSRRKWAMGPESQAVFQEFKKEVDPFLGWYSEFVTDLVHNKEDITDSNRSERVENSKLLGAYRQFCEESNFRVAGNMIDSRKFGQKIKALLNAPGDVDRGYQTRGPSGASVRGYWGIRLAAES